jgi:DNA-binding NarL/FixJ family response regulator
LGVGSWELGVEYDHLVPILAAVDDFLFRSKIRATAKHVNAEIVFAQTPDEILAQARALKPSLVIIDLNSTKADAVSTIASLKADPELAGIRAIGFASHVHADLIAAARKAGADQVLPRSAFAGNLGEILASGIP